MPVVEIKVNATLADIESFIEFVESQIERVYIATAGMTTVGAIEIMGARLVSEDDEEMG
jgi:hypothetical protein